MKEWFNKFIQGRYGGDEYGRHLSVIAIVFLLLSVLFYNILQITIASSICFVIGMGIIFRCYYRMFSKDITHRTAENEKYLASKAETDKLKAQRKARAEQKNTYKFFKCPNCKVYNRIPKGKGKVEITCPKCGEKFIRKS